MQESNLPPTVSLMLHQLSYTLYSCFHPLRGGPFGVAGLEPATFNALSCRAAHAAHATRSLFFYAVGLDRIELSSPTCFGRRFTQGVAYRKPRTLRLTTPIKLEILYLARHPRGMWRHCRTRTSISFTPLLLRRRKAEPLRDGASEGALLN